MSMDDDNEFGLHITGEAPEETYEECFEALPVPEPTKPANTVKPKVEEVLCFAADKLDMCPEFTGILTDPEKIRGVLNIVMAPANLSYFPRDGVEHDPSWKQVIPYCVLKMNNKVFKYQRTKKGGEVRLHDLWSVGVGGHINPGDGSGIPGMETYEAAMLRELAEEVGLTGGHWGNAIRGLIYDPSDEVGEVHFGVVHVLDLDVTCQVHAKDPALAHGHFDFINPLKNKLDGLENWSKLVVQHVL